MKSYFVYQEKDTQLYFVYLRKPYKGESVTNSIYSLLHLRGWNMRHGFTLNATNMKHGLVTDRFN